MFLDIIHRPVFIKNTILSILQNATFQRLESVSVFRAQSVELVSISGDSTDRTVFLDEDRMLDNVQKHNICPGTLLQAI
jgi:hypothetical protein